MPEAGHFQRLRPLINALAGRGIEPHVFTDRRFADEVERSGGRFIDLFAGRPLEAADAESTPFPCRYVSFAGHFAEEVVAQVEALSPAVVVYDTFAAIGPVVGRALGVPYVNVCAGHNMDPATVEALVSNHPRVEVSERCRMAVEKLRERYRIADASPFSYITGLSPHLNLYCEPEEFLQEAERAAFEPVAFYGSLPALEEIEANARAPSSSHFGAAGELRLYVSFGTVAWRYWPAEALDALRAISTAVGRRPDARALISLGGAELEPDSRKSLERENVTVADRVDQWRVLGEADAFITHQGLNSTHQAIYKEAPMLSYPFFSDQPALARRCVELGLAVALAGSVREPLTPESVDRGLAELNGKRDSLLGRLSEAREWELRVLGERGAVIERIASLGGQ
jgi:UDP:flavonoid glycosyltransferase YjiC (YdhE family)